MLELQIACRYISVVSVFSLFLIESLTSTVCNLACCFNFILKENLAPTIYIIWLFLAANESIMAVYWNVFSPWICDKYPLPSLCGCPIRSKQKCFWLPCLLSPGAFLSAAVLFLHRCVSRLRRIGTVWLAVWRQEAGLTAICCSDCWESDYGDSGCEDQKVCGGVYAFPCLIFICSCSRFLQVSLHAQVRACIWAQGCMFRKGFHPVILLKKSTPRAKADVEQHWQ